MPSFETLILLAIYFAACLGGSIAVIPILKRWKIEDPVNHRSSHKTTTPRGGGFGFVPPLLIGWLVVNLMLSATIFWWIAWAATTAFALSAAIDDLARVSARMRLLVYALLAAGSVAAIAVTSGFGQTGLLAILLPPAAAFALLWWVNVVNFMDGIDGISVVEAMTLAVAVLVLLWLRPMGEGDAIMAYVAALIGLAALAFATVNWHPARVFMGDVGAVALGAATGFLFLAFLAEGRVIELIIVAAVYLWDATFTLLSRLVRGEPIFRPHRAHGYQLFVAKGYGHDTASLMVAGVNVVLIGVAVARPWLGDILAMALALAPAIGLYTVFVRAPERASG